MAQKVWLLDAGHGGVNEQGIYTTAPNFDITDSSTWRKSYYHPEAGDHIFEGEYNRKIRKELIQLIVKDAGMKWFILNHGHEDMSLHRRCNMANQYHDFHGDCVVVSIHGNAGKGTGIEGYTSPGETESDSIATIFLEEAAKEFPEQTMRFDHSDGDPDKEAPFYILKHTKCPAILMEYFFMDRLKDFKLMKTDECHKRVAKSMFNAMKRVDES